MSLKKIKTENQNETKEIFKKNELSEVKEGFVEEKKDIKP